MQHPRRIHYHALLPPSSENGAKRNKQYISLPLQDAPAEDRSIKYSKMRAPETHSPATGGCQEHTHCNNKKRFCGDDNCSHSSRWLSRLLPFLLIPASLPPGVRQRQSQLSSRLSKRRKKKKLKKPQEKKEINTVKSKKRSREKKGREGEDLMRTLGFDNTRRDANRILFFPSLVCVSGGFTLQVWRRLCEKGYDPFFLVYESLLVWNEKSDICSLSCLLCWLFLFYDP